MYVFIEVYRTKHLLLLTSPTAILVALQMAGPRKCRRFPNHSRAPHHSPEKAPRAAILQLDTDTTGKKSCDSLASPAQPKHMRTIGCGLVRTTKGLDCSLHFLAISHNIGGTITFKFSSPCINVPNMPPAFDGANQGYLEEHITESPAQVRVVSASHTLSHCLLPAPPRQVLKRILAQPAGPPRPPHYLTSSRQHAADATDAADATASHQPWRSKSEQLPPPPARVAGGWPVRGQERGYSPPSPPQPLARLPDVWDGARAALAPQVIRLRGTRSPKGVPSLSLSLACSLAPRRLLPLSLIISLSFKKFCTDSHSCSPACHIVLTLTSTADSDTKSRRRSHARSGRSDSERVGWLSVYRLAVG
jgi:hypothetical protein